MDGKCMELVVAGKEDRTVSHETKTLVLPGNLVIPGTPLVVIPPAVTRLKKIRVAYLLQLFQGNEEKGLHDLVCGAPLDNWANVGLF